MDIQATWDKLSETKFSGHIENKQIMEAIQKESTSNISTIYNGLKIKERWVLFFIATFSVAMVFSFRNLEAELILAAMNLPYIMGYFLLKRARKKINLASNFEHNVLTSLKENQSLIDTIFTLERNSVFIITPILTFAALILPKVYAGLPFDLIIADNKFLLTAVIIIPLSIPLSYWLGNKMNQVAFEPYQKRLRNNIAKLEVFETQD